VVLRAIWTYGRIGKQGNFFRLQTILVYDRDGFMVLVEQSDPGHLKFAEFAGQQA
jgi:hypothetical protein